MASMLNGTMNTAKNVMDAARDGAEQAFDSARHGTEHAVQGTRSALLDVVHTLGGLFVTLRGLDTDDALGWVGLARRRGPFPSIALFGAGMMVGAGIGVLFAPMSGAQMRSAILGRLKGVKEEAKRSTVEVASEVKDVEKKVERKVEDLAGKAGDAVKKAEQKIETKVNAGAEAVKDAVLQKVDTAASAVKNAVDDAKSGSTTAKPYGQASSTRHQS